MCAISPGVWVHPSYGVRTDRPHSVWSCALSEGTCGGRCLPCTSQEGNNLSPLDCVISPGVWVHPSYGVRTDRPHGPYGLVRSPRAPAVGVACLAPVKREITFPLDCVCFVSPGVWVHPSYGVRTDRPHSVWSCALSEAPAVGVACLAPVRGITFPLLTGK